VTASSPGRSASGADPRVSVVLATYNRPELLERLLRQLAVQTLPPGQFEVVIVDDGSPAPVGDVRDLSSPCKVTLIRQANAGAAAARHRGALAARGEVLVITDDDMQVAPDFLEGHLARHEAGSRRVVVGRIRSSAQLSEMPIFERFHAALLDRWGQRRLHGDAVCTGNMSLRRADYLAVGGFDTSLERAEDIDLGFRLEQDGVEVTFSEEAASVHDSDHTSFAVWRRRAVLYGRCWTRMGRKYPRVLRADPWHAFYAHSAAKRPFVMLAVALPALGAFLAHAAQHAATGADRLSLDRLAVSLTSLLWELEFFRGVRQETGDLGACVRSCLSFVGKVEASGEAIPRVGSVSRFLRRILPLQYQ
jgi:glycosyltransferase involved in cell wall biosynthesis